jgi:hypothetical protein
MSNETDAKKPFLILLLKQKENLESTLEYYNKLENSIPEKNHWRIMKTDDFQKKQFWYPGSTTYPSRQAEIAMKTIDEYIEAIESFTEDQFAAFIMGLGINWIPIQYWGMENLSNYYYKIQQDIAYYEKLESELPKDQHWKIKELNPLNAYSLTVSMSEEPTKILHQISDLVKSMLSILSEKWI